MITNRTNCPLCVAKIEGRHADSGGTHLFRNEKWYRRIISHCMYCHRIIWPWQRQGFLTLSTSTARWHTRCRREQQP